MKVFNKDKDNKEIHIALEDMGDRIDIDAVDASGDFIFRIACIENGLLKLQPGLKEQLEMSNMDISELYFNENGSIMVTCE